MRYLRRKCLRWRCKYLGSLISHLRYDKLRLKSWLKCDIGNAEDVENAFSQISSKFPNRKISILINNAAHNKLLPLLDHEKITNESCLKPGSLKEASDVFKSLMDTNILGPTLVTRAAMEFFDHEKVPGPWISNDMI